MKKQKKLRVESLELRPRSFEKGVLRSEFGVQRLKNSQLSTHNSQRFLLLLLLIALNSQLSTLNFVYGWGGTAHRIINKNAIAFLPSEIKGFYDKNRKKIIEGAIAPDLWKGEDRQERTRHFINLDQLEPYPFPSFPLSYEQAIKKYGRNKVETTGTVPWRINEFFERLVRAFQQKKWNQVVEISSWLGHYVGDAYEPLHTTENYDGLKSKNDGIHLRFEDEMVRENINDFRVTVASPAREVSDVMKFLFDFIREGYLTIPEIMQGDLEAKKKGDIESEEYFFELYSRTGELARKRMAGASWSLSCLWYSAWLRAGKPELKQ